MEATILAVRDPPFVLMRAWFKIAKRLLYKLSIANISDRGSGFGIRDSEFGVRGSGRIKRDSGFKIRTFRVNNIVLRIFILTIKSY